MIKTYSKEKVNFKTEESDIPSKGLILNTYNTEVKKNENGILISEEKKIESSFVSEFILSSIAKPNLFKSILNKNKMKMENTDKDYENNSIQKDSLTFKSTPLNGSVVSANSTNASSHIVSVRGNPVGPQREPRFSSFFKHKIKESQSKLRIYKLYLRNTFLFLSFRI